MNKESNSKFDPMKYLQGECNLNGREITLRRIIGFAGAAVTVGLGVGIGLVEVPWYAYIFLFIFAFIASLGFAQSNHHFCVYYGLTGKNSITADGKIQNIVNKEQRKADKINAIKLIIQAIVLGLVMTMAVFLCRTML